MAIADAGANTVRCQGLGAPLADWLGRTRLNGRVEGGVTLDWIGLGWAERGEWIVDPWRAGSRLTDYGALRTYSVCSA